MKTVENLVKRPEKTVFEPKNGGNHQKTLLEWLESHLDDFYFF